MNQHDRHIVLIGNPNAGKTTLFNSLTGLSQKTSNLPGTTIEEKNGYFEHNAYRYKVTDLPGTYSIYPNSEDERIAIQYTLKHLKSSIDYIVYVADASNLQRNLLLFSQIADLKIPIILALNMMDIAQEKGITFQVEQLSKELGVFVVPIQAKNNKGIKILLEKIEKPIQALQTDFYKNHEMIPYFELVQKRTEIKSQNEEFIQKEISTETASRYTQINEILKLSVIKESKNTKTRTQKIDELLLHPIYGFLTFFTALFIIFQLVFKIAETPTEWIDSLFSYLSQKSSEILPSGVLNNLISEGILPGIGGIVVFLPQIILLFTFLSFLEESGYMTRVSFITDRLMRKFGLNGKSIVPLVGGMACAIPSIMACRNIENQKDRLITILVTPLMSCSARLPVYTLLISLLATNDSAFLDIRGFIMLGMYILGFLASIGFALLFKWILKQKEKSFFILEMPDYRLPRLKNILIIIKNKTFDFVFNAGKIILLISIALWFLASYGPKSEFKNIELKYANYTFKDKELKIKSEKLEASYAGILGKTIEPIIKPLGYDWKIGIALITSFAAREVFTGTIATIYSVNYADEEGEEKQELLKILKSQKRVDNGQPVYSIATILSLLIFYAFAMQCMSTLAITYRETKKIKWPIIQFLYMSGFAYLMSFLTYQILS